MFAQGIVLTTIVSFVMGRSRTTTREDSLVEVDYCPDPAGEDGKTASAICCGCASSRARDSPAVKHCPGTDAPTKSPPVDVDPTIENTLSNSCHTDDDCEGGCYVCSRHCTYDHRLLRDGSLQDDNEGRFLGRGGPKGKKGKKSITCTHIVKCMKDINDHRNIFENNDARECPEHVDPKYTGNCFYEGPPCADQCSEDPFCLASQQSAETLKLFTTVEAPVGGACSSNECSAADCQGKNACHSAGCKWNKKKKKCS